MACPNLNPAPRARTSFVIEADLLERLRVLGSAKDTGLFAVLLAGLSLLLLRYFGSDDIALAGQNGETPPIPLTLRVPDDPSFLDLLDRIRDAIQNGGVIPDQLASFQALLILSNELSNDITDAARAQYGLIEHIDFKAIHPDTVVTEVILPLATQV